MGCVMWVIDKRVQKIFPGMTKSTKPRQLVIFPKTTKIASIAPWVIYYRPKGLPIDRLYIFAHGDSGCVQLGEGLWAYNAHQLSPLAEYFDDLGYVEIHACGVASDTSITKGGDPHKIQPGSYKNDGKGFGYSFLKAIADATGVSVTGAIHAQLADSSWLYEGKTLTVAPGGGSW